MYAIAFIYQRLQSLFVLLVILTLITHGYGDPVQTVDLSGTWTFTPVGGSSTTIQVPGGGWCKQGFTSISDADYSRSITIPSIGQPQVTMLKFGAVNYEADVYINGILVGTNVQSFTPASFDISSFVVPGNTYNLRVRVKGRQAFMLNGKSLVPNAAGWSPNTPQGIFRSAQLLVYPQIFISDVFVRPSVQNSNLYYDVWVTNATASATNLLLSGDLSSWNGSDWSYPTLPSEPLSLPAGTTTKVTIGPVSWNLGPSSYWWPNVPYQPGYTAQLHYLNLSITPPSGSPVMDHTSTRFGFRELVQRSDGSNTCYFLNGIRVNFRGDNLQGADYDSIVYDGGPGDAYDTLPGFLPGTNGWPKAVDNYQRLNFNFVRLHQEPVTPYMLDVCDEKGLMVMEETAIRGSANDQDFINGHDYMVNHLKALYTRDRNHPCIVRESLDNEPDQASTDSTQFETDLYNAAMSVDGTRPVSIDVGVTGDTYESMSATNFSVYHHYADGQFGQYVDDVFARPDRPFGEGEFIWPADSTAQGFTWFATTTQAMRAQGASDIRPYTLLSAWASFVPGVQTTQMTLEQGGHPLYGADNLPNPWTNSQIQRVQAAFNPVLVADTNYWYLARGSTASGDWPTAAPYLTANTTFTRALRIYNDTFSGTNVDVYWELYQGATNGTLSTSGHFTTTVPLGYSVVQNITFTTPNVADGTVLYLVLYAKKDGMELFRENDEKFMVGQPIIPTATYQIINRNSGMALNAGTGLGGNVDQVNTGISASQQWVVQNLGSNVYNIINVSNPRYLDVYGVSTSDGANIEVWDYTGKDNQKWIIQSLGGGYYSLTAMHSGKVLDVYGQSLASGANVDQWSWNGGWNQQWSFVINTPSTPTGLNATAGNNLVNLTWDAASYATSYNVKRSTNGSGSYTIIGTPTTTNYTDTTTVNGTTYYYVVSAVNVTGESGNSTEASATPASVGPNGPGFITNSISGSTLTLSWPGGQGWRLQTRTNLVLGNWQYVTDGGVSSTNISVDATKPTVFYRLTFP